MQKVNVDAYIQDTWKATPHLTVNVGLRWEPYLPPKNLTGSIYNFSMANLIAGVKSTQFNNAPPGSFFPGDPGFQDHTGENNYWDLFAPRVALAWDPKGDGKTVFRASFGIAYDYNSGELLVNAADAPPYGGTEIFAGTRSAILIAWERHPDAPPARRKYLPLYGQHANAPFAAGGIYIAIKPHLKATASNQYNGHAPAAVGS